MVSHVYGQFLFLDCLALTGKNQMNRKGTLALLTAIFTIAMAGFVPGAHAGSQYVTQTESVPCGNIVPMQAVYTDPSPETTRQYPYLGWANVTFPNSVCDALGLQAWQSSYEYVYNDAGQWLENSCSGSYSCSCNTGCSGLLGMTWGNLCTSPYNGPGSLCNSYTAPFPALNTNYHIYVSIQYYGTDGAGNLDAPDYQYTLTLYVASNGLAGIEIYTYPTTDIYCRSIGLAIDQPLPVPWWPSYQSGYEISPSGGQCGAFTYYEILQFPTGS